MKTALGIPVLALALLATAACADLPPAPDAPPPEYAQAAPAYSQEQLDQMLAPIALYPDSLLTQILMASTYPLEVVEAARWAKARPGLQGDAAVQAAQVNHWDPSVMSLVAFPQILSMMNEKLDWTERLGDAFLSQQADVMNTVQALRQRAYQAGTLQSDAQIRIEQPQPQTIVIETVQPNVVYVPYYDPAEVYGGWWWPEYPPVFWDPWPGYYYRPGFAFGWGGGVVVGTGFFFGGCDWYHRSVVVVNQNSFYYRNSYNNVTRFNNGSYWGRYSAKAGVNGAPVWQHDPSHRRGVPYPTVALRQQFGRMGAAPDARGVFRPNMPAEAHPFGGGNAFRNNSGNASVFSGNRGANSNRGGESNGWQHWGGNGNRNGNGNGNGDSVRGENVRSGMNGNGSNGAAVAQPFDHRGEQGGEQGGERGGERGGFEGNVVARPAPVMPQPRVESPVMQPHVVQSQPSASFSRPAAPARGNSRPSRGGGGGSREHR